MGCVRMVYSVVGIHNLVYREGNACVIITRDNRDNCDKKTELNQHLPQTLILIPNNPLRRPRRNNHIISQPPRAKTRLTVHKIKQPLSSKRFDLEVVGIGVFRAVILADSTFPVPHELVPPREERLAVVRARVLHGCHLEGAVCADVDGS